MSDYSDALEELAKIEHRMGEGENDWERAAEDAVRTKQEFEIAMAKATVRQRGGTVGEREANALIECEEQHRWKAEAEGREAARKVTMKLLESRATSLQARLKAMTREAPQSGPAPAWTGSRGQGAQ